MKRYFPFLVLLFLCTTAWSESLNNRLTTPVSEDGGDRITSFNVTLDSYTPKLIDAGNSVNSSGVVQRTVRRRTIANRAAFTVYIGSGAALNTNWASMGYALGETTNTAIPNTYTTYTSSAIYGACMALNASCIVNVIKETNTEY